MVEMFRQSWRWSLGHRGLLRGLRRVHVCKTSDATARPDGVYFVFELLWRGVGDGMVDTLLLTIFPGLVAYKLQQGTSPAEGEAAVTAVMLPLVLVITATYHLGYPQYRQDGVSRRRRETC